MAKTAVDVIHRALRRLNIIAPGEDPDADIYQDALDEYKVFTEWMRQEFTRGNGWNYDSVDERYWTHIAGMLAGRLANVLPCSDSIAAKAKEGAAESERYLREQLARKPLRDTEVQYF